ncbi:MAG: peptidyl-prolyl cis-trans isomerase [Acidobacteriota bacterium]
MRILLGGLLLVLAACSSGAPPAPETPVTASAAAPAPTVEEKPTSAQIASNPEVLAVVEGTAITLEDFRLAMELRGGAARYPDRERRQALLDELIQNRILLVKALDEGYDHREDVVRSFEKILVNLYRRENLEESAAVEVTPEDIAAYYEAHPERFMRPARSRLAMLLIERSPRLDDEGKARLKARAAEVYEQAAALGDDVKGFGPLARKYSDDAATKYVGGVVGWLYPRRVESYKWAAEVLAPAFALEEPGDMSTLIEGEDGYYLWRLLEREQAEPRPLERVQDGIAGILRKERQDERRRAFAAEQREGVDLWTGYERLEALPEVAAEDKSAGPPPLPGG